MLTVFTNMFRVKGTHHWRVVCLLGSLVLAQTVQAQPQERGRRGGFGRAVEGPRLEPDELDFKDGVGKIPDVETFDRLAYKGPEVMIDAYLADLKFVKFTLVDLETDEPTTYFINTKAHRAHMRFMGQVGIGRGRGQMRGAITFHPKAKSPSGKAGVYTFDFQPNSSFSFEEIKLAQQLLLAHAPFLKGQLVFHPLRGNVKKYESEKTLYDNSDIVVYTDDKLFTDVGFLPLNAGETFGRLRVMKQGELPAPSDVVLYETLPNEMPRVSGVITSARQTPLSHVNLRAIQDRIPNAYIVNALEDARVKPLIDHWVAYTVTTDGFELRSATQEEVDAFSAKSRPSQVQTPARDLQRKEIRALSELDFRDSTSVGVKAANLAAMHRFELGDNTFPKGHTVPFYFYDEFMKHNGFYKVAATIIADEELKQNPAKLSDALKAFRKQIKQAEMPEWMLADLSKLHASYPVGQSLRCRSSTNNEDLPGFSGAGLYDSYTHKKDEGHLSKSIKQVYASLWNDGAFEQREFNRVNHLEAAMGVLVHPNYKGELINGVAVTDDILYGTAGNYYINSQVGEDLVTNPEEASMPEELLLDWWDSKTYTVMSRSNRATADTLLLTDEQRDVLSICLARIHSRFKKHYGVSDDEPFAIEIEFKVTKDNRLIIKQARPWVF